MMGTTALGMLRIWELIVVGCSDASSQIMGGKEKGRTLTNRETTHHHEDRQSVKKKKKKKKKK